MPPGTRLYAQALCSLFVASCDWQGYDGSIRPPPPHWSSLYSPGTDHTENISSTILCSLVAGETTCTQNYFLALAVVQSPAFTAVTWQWVYMSQYLFCTFPIRSSFKKLNILFLFIFSFTSVYSIRSFRDNVDLKGACHLLVFVNCVR
jgi:hypothetical protein